MIAQLRARLRVRSSSGTMMAVDIGVLVDLLVVLLLLRVGLRPVSDPASKQDLDNATGVLRGEMSAMEARIRDDMKAMETGLRGDMKTMETGLRDDMKTMETGLRDDMKTMETGIRGDMKTMETGLRGDIQALDARFQAMETRLLHEIGSVASHVANVMAEEFRRQVAAVDDKYRDLPSRHAELRADFDTHAVDFRLHTRRAVAPKRSRSPRSR